VLASGGSAPQAVSAIATPQASSGNAGAVSTSIAGSYTFSRQVLTCSTGWTCPPTQLPMTITCSSADSCVVSSSHWGSAAHPVTFNGTTISFSGTDLGVVDCNSAPIPATLAFDLTVVSWSKGSDSVRRPQKIQGPYSYTAAADNGCSYIQSKEIITFSAPAASASGSSGNAVNPHGFDLPLTAASGTPSLTGACQWQYPSDPGAVAQDVPGSSTVAAYTVQCVDGSDNLGGLDLSGYCGSLVSGMVATNPDSAGAATDQPPPWEQWECTPPSTG
jgi:hypothetical protein